MAAAASILFLLFLVSAAPIPTLSDTDAADAAVLSELLRLLDGGGAALPSWSGADPCGAVWPYIQCDGTSVTAIQLKGAGLSGRLPPSLRTMSNLQTIALQGNNFTGPLPSFRGMSSLRYAYLDFQSFTSIPPDFFAGLSSLAVLSLDYSPLNASSGGWSLPSGDIAGLRSLTTLSLTATFLSGGIPASLASLPNLQHLHLAYNYLAGPIPAAFSAASRLLSLQLNNQLGPFPLNGSISAIAGIQSLSQIWLHFNAFSGTIPPSFSSFPSLQDLRLHYNLLVGPIPPSFASSASPSFSFFSVQHNLLLGPIPSIPSLPSSNFSTSDNGFCSPFPGAPCSPEVLALVDFLAGFGFPPDLSASWQGNDPCASWIGISCNSSSGKVVTINLQHRQLSGTISPSVANLSSLQNLILNDNAITGTIPASLATLKSLRRLSLQNNNISLPSPLLPGVSVNLTGNAAFDNAAAASPSPSATSKEHPPAAAVPPVTAGVIPANGGVGASNATSAAAAASAPGGARSAAGSESTSKSSSSVPLMLGGVAGAVCVAFLAGMLAVVLVKKRKKNTRVQSPHAAVSVHPEDGHGGDSLKLCVGNSMFDLSEILADGLAKGEAAVVEAGHLLISMQVLRNVTQNFSEKNVLGRGGFGVVYKGELDDGTKIAVKRMEAAMVSSKGLKEFHAEIGVLTKVRHRHLVALLGYCIDGGERLLVYEYLPLGPLSRHLFEHQELHLPPLSLKLRLSIALDVARGMEYLHGFAHEASFIHRDLKSSNILLADDYRAKVSDFGLVKLASDKSSVETRLAGTFGYLAPEYAVTGRVTTKSDVFSYGVVLMELLTGRKALDETRPEESMHLVGWFRTINVKSDEELLGAVDPALEVTEEAIESVRAVAELAGHCTMREAGHRPDMSHAVNVLLPLVEQWKPSDVEGDDGIGIDLDMTLPQALKKWQAFEGATTSTSAASSAFFSRSDLDNTNGSMPSRPNGFADSFTSSDGR